MTTATAGLELVSDEDLDEQPEAGRGFGSYMGRAHLAQQELDELDSKIEGKRSAGPPEGMDDFDYLYDNGLLFFQQPGYKGWGAPLPPSNGNGHKPESVGAILDTLGDRLRAFREKLPEDSPLAGSAFRLASLLGELQARIDSQ